jgi:hypothetical protein
MTATKYCQKEWPSEGGQLMLKTIGIVLLARRNSGT